MQREESFIQGSCSWNDEAREDMTTFRSVYHKRCVQVFCLRIYQKVQLSLLHEV